MSSIKTALNKTRAENPGVTWISRDSSTHYFYLRGKPIAKLSSEDGSWIIENRVASYALRDVSDIPAAISRSAGLDEDLDEEESMMSKQQEPLPVEIQRMSSRKTSSDGIPSGHFDAAEFSELKKKEEAGLAKGSEGLSSDSSVRGNVKLALNVPAEDAARVRRIISSALRDAGFDIDAGDVPEGLKKHQFTEDKNPNPKGSDADGDGKKSEEKPFESKKAKKAPSTVQGWLEWLE